MLTSQTRAVVVKGTHRLLQRQVVSLTLGEVSDERIFHVCLHFPPAHKETVGARVAHQMAEEFCGISGEHSSWEDQQSCGKSPVSVIQEICSFSERSINDRFGSPSQRSGA